MNERTKAKYLKRAAYFYRTRLGSEVPTNESLIIDALLRAAPDYTPASWRELRNALEYAARSEKNTETADRIKATKNPTTQTKQAKRKPKQQRVKRISEDDTVALYAAAQARGDTALEAALILAIELGCRPAEMPNVRLIDDGRVFILGAKKTREGNRGLDRIVQVNETDLIEWAIDTLAAAPDHASGKIHCVQSRLQRLVTRLWPRRKRRPSLYSFRHQLGSDLKREGRERREIAYIMGHQATKSADKYGDPRSRASGRDIKPGVGPEEITEQVRENHKPPYSQQVPAEPDLGAEDPLATDPLTSGNDFKM